MKKLLLSILILLFSVSYSYAGTPEARVFDVLIGGGTGALDAVSAASLTTGDIAFVFESDGDVYLYVYDSTDSTSEDSPWTIEPDAGGGGAWQLTKSFSTYPQATPKVVLRDSDATDFDDNAYIQIACTDTGSGTEDCDLSIYQQVAGSATELFKIDADGEVEVALDMDLASGKVYKINNAQIDIGDLAAGGDWTPTGTINLGSTTDTVFKAGTVDADDLVLQKDLVTGASLTGGTNDILPGTDSDVTIAVTVADDEITADAHEVVFTTDNATLESDGDLNYNPSTGTLSSTEFSGGGGSLTGVDAATGDSATDFFDAGEIADARISDTHSHAADSIDAITEIAAALKSGADTTLVTGTAGTNTYVGVWNSDGDLVDGPGVPYVVGGTDVADADVVDTLTASNYLPLAGGTLTGELVIDNLGAEFTAGDDHSDCTAFSATGGGIFFDDSEGIFKKCQDNVLTDLDTTGGTPATADISDVSVTQTELAELETIDATTISAAQWTGLGGATTAGIALWDDADAAAQRTTLGLVIGTNVLAPDGNGSSLTAVDAATGDSATAFFDVGEVADARIANDITITNISQVQDISATAAEINTIDDCATTELFVGGGAGSAPVCTTAEGTGAPVRAGTPTLTTPVIGAATGTSLIVSGVLQGLLPVTVTTAATLVMTTANTKGDLHQNGDADAIDYTLPGAAAGLSACFMAGEFTGVITIDPVDGTDTIYLNGASVGAGDSIDSPGTVGDFICLVAIDSTKWYTLGQINTWIDGGP